MVMQKKISFSIFFSFLLFFLISSPKVFHWFFSSKLKIQNKNKKVKKKMKMDLSAFDTKYNAVQVGN